jgi:hypothetical protein
MGHMTKSSRTFCTILKSHPDVLDQLRQCCFEEDSHVRKVEKKIPQIFSEILFLCIRWHFSSWEISFPPMKFSMNMSMN